MKEWADCVVYEFCRNQIRVIHMQVDKEFGEYWVSYCGYRGDEFHQIFLGKIN